MVVTGRVLSYRILNVFTDGDIGFSGNPLCVFEDATGLSEQEMQNLARQLNLSETTFITPGDADVSANVRIFTPNYEMPFAGHPSLGTAHVVRELSRSGDTVLLRMPAGDSPVRRRDNLWTLQANAPVSFPVDMARADLSAMIGLSAGRLAGEPLWVDTGALQLILPLRRPAMSPRRPPIPSSWPSSPRSRTASRWSTSGPRRVRTRSRLGASSPRATR
jgi:trans-2,3-dihydro-3-hydroxyanthranilate isomerase